MTRRCSIIIEHTSTTTSANVPIRRTIFRFIDGSKVKHLSKGFEWLFLADSFAAPLLLLVVVIWFLIGVLLHALI